MKAKITIALLFVAVLTLASCRKHKQSCAAYDKVELGQQP